MDIHAPATTLSETMINELKRQHTVQKVVAQFEDPIREFHRASRLEGTARNWLTLSVDERKKRVLPLAFRARFLGDPARNIEPESEQQYQNHELERWRTLMVIIQEETRAAMEARLKPPDQVRYEHAPEVAIMALKFAMPEHPWNKGK